MTPSGSISPVARHQVPRRCSDESRASRAGSTAPIATTTGSRLAEPSRHVLEPELPSLGTASCARKAGEVPPARAAAPLDLCRVKAIDFQLHPQVHVHVGFIVISFDQLADKLRESKRAPRVQQSPPTPGSLLQARSLKAGWDRRRSMCRSPGRRRWRSWALRDSAPASHVVASKRLFISGFQTPASFGEPAFLSLDNAAMPQCRECRSRPPGRVDRSVPPADGTAAKFRGLRRADGRPGRPRSRVRE